MNARPKTLIAGPIRSRINVLAHRLAQQQEMRLRDDLTRRVEAARVAGASFSELVGLLDTIERNGMSEGKSSS